MCDPLTIALGGSALVGVAGSYFGGEAQKDAAKENKKVSEMTLAQTKEIYGETKAQIILDNKSLISYAEGRGLDLQSLLLDSDDAALKSALSALDEAKTQDLQGNDFAAAELIRGIGKASDILKESKENYTPWMSQGLDANQGALDATAQGVFANQELIDKSEELTRRFTLDDFEVDPGYQFRLTEGQDAIINRASALGVTGNTVKDIVKYSQDVASSEFGAANTRFVDWQSGVKDYYSNIVNNSNTLAAGYNSIANRGLDATNSVTAINNSLAGYSRDEGAVRSAQAGNRSNILSDFIANKGKLTTQNIINRGSIKAGTIQTEVGRRENITQNQNNQLIGLAGGNVNALTNYSGSVQNANTQQGNAQSNMYTNLANTGTNFLQNYLFLKASQTQPQNFNNVAGAGSPTIANTFPASPDNMLYQP